MRITQPIVQGRLIKRYKRFLADVELADGAILTAHCPNPGRMIGCSEPGSTVWLRDSQDKKRKLLYTLQTVEASGVRINVDTGLPNACVPEAVEAGEIPELRGYDTARREVKYGSSSRIDLLLEKSSGERCYVEIKSTTMAEGEYGLFPDAVTARGLKHLDELVEVVSSGHRAVMFFFISRGDVTRFAPADDIDPAYADRLREAARAGVELLAWTSNVTPSELTLKEPVTVDLETRVALRVTS